MSSPNLHPDAAAAADYTLADLVRDAARCFTDRTAVIGSGLTLTYRELDDRTDRLAAGLVRRGVGRGDRIAIASTTRPEYIETLVATAKIGATTVGLNFRMHSDELLDCVTRSGAGLLLAAPEFVDTMRRVSARTRRQPPVVALGASAVDASSEYHRLLDEDGPLETRPGPEDIHAVIFTSGTTGRPKGAMISQRAGVVRAIRHAQWHQLTPDDGLVGWVPLFHTSIETVFATLLSGGRWATFEQPDIEAMFAAIERHRLTWISLLPGVLNRFLDHPSRDDYDLSTLRGAVGYGNMMPRAVTEFTERFGAEFWDAYGQTEASSLIARAVIRPGDTDPTFRKYPAALISVRLVDDDQREVPDGEPGACVVRGPGLMSGYLDDPDATEEVFRGGWLHTGDVLRRHPDGGLSFVERAKYLIKTGGENVYPAEIEQVLATHDAVREVCVVGVPDERWGETVVAFVVTHGEAVPSESLDQWCAQRLSRFKRPRRFHVIDAEDVPRSATGKILRDRLEQRARSGSD